MIELLDTKRIGLGCMNLSHAYGTPPSTQDSLTLLYKALDLGYNHFDTATLYGFGANETLVGTAIKNYRDQLFLASKCGLFKGDDGKRALSGRPETLLKNCEHSLKRLNVEVIDLYYLHRWDKTVPIEDSVGALAQLVKEGKIRHIGLSEVSADTLRKAAAVHPITAIQTEYSLWTRNSEISVLNACNELGTTFVAFSPVARGYLGELTDVGQLEEGDLRRNMPRFSPDIYAKNLQLLEPVKKLAKDKHATVAQLSLAWLLTRNEHLVAIPGTTSISHLEDNFKALQISLTHSELEILDQAINQKTVFGPRYPDAVQLEIDTEEF